MTRIEGLTIGTLNRANILWCRSSPRNKVLCACLIILGLHFILVPEKSFLNAAPPEPLSATKGEIDDLVADLGSEEFSTRELATRRLIGLGSPVCDRLEQLVLDEDPELRGRAFLILKEFYAGADPDAGDVAQTILERLKESGVPSVALRAEAIWKSYFHVVETRSLKRLTNAGARIINPPSSRASTSGNGGRVLLVTDAYQIFLGSGWKGSSALLFTELRRLLDLKQTRRESPGEFPLAGQLGGLYYTPAAQVDFKALTAFAREHAALISIEQRGEAYLGITQMAESGSPTQPGLWEMQPLSPVIVSEVKEDSPAKFAGIRSGDQILSFGGQEIRNFRHLLTLIASRRIGERVAIELQGDDKQMREVTVELHGW